MDLDPRRLLDELQPAKTIIVMAARYCKYLCQIGYENSRKNKIQLKQRHFDIWETFETMILANSLDEK